MTALYSDAELQEMSADFESDLLERKRSASDGDKIRRNICALANDLPEHRRPGVILIGVEDNGDCSNLAIDDRLLRTVSSMRDDGNILPLPSMVIQKRTVNGCEVVVMFVYPSRHPPVRYKGRVWIKLGPTTRQATSEEEQRLSERHRAGDLPFDMRPAFAAKTEDLDLSYIEAHYLPFAIAQDVLVQNRRPLEQQLRSLRLLVNENPTWGSLIGLSRDPLGWIPGAFVQFLRFDGRAVTDPIVSENRLDGRLEDVLRRLDELLKLNVKTRVDVTAGSRELRRPDYPLPALQQLARNAIMHRSYEASNAPVRVYWYEDRIEMASPGGLYGQVTPQNFGMGATDYRNPLVAEIMHHMGFAQRFGLGIPLAEQELKSNGNPRPTFEFEPTSVRVTIRSAT